jgi:hypothetical protein
MKFLHRQSFLSSAICSLLLCATAFAQEGPRSEEVSNAMGAHTWFIILAVGAFLAWSISYSLQLQKEALKRKKGREDLVHRRDELLTEIANLEARKESGAVSEQRYKQDFKDLKYRLAKIIEKLSTGTQTKKAR